MTDQLRKEFRSGYGRCGQGKSLQRLFGLFASGDIHEHALHGFRYTRFTSDGDHIMDPDNASIRSNHAVFRAMGQPFGGSSKTACDGGLTIVRVNVVGPKVWLVEPLLHGKAQEFLRMRADEPERHASGFCFPDDTMKILDQIGEPLVGLLKRGLTLFAGGDIDHRADHANGGA